MLQGSRCRNAIRVICFGSHHKVPMWNLSELSISKLGEVELGLLKLCLVFRSRLWRWIENARLNDLLECPEEFILTAQQSAIQQFSHRVRILDGFGCGLLRSLIKARVSQDELFRIDRAIGVARAQNGDICKLRYVDDDNPLVIHHEALN